MFYMKYCAMNADYARLTLIIYGLFVNTCALITLIESNWTGIMYFLFIVFFSLQTGYTDKVTCIAAQKGEEIFYIQLQGKKKTFPDAMTENNFTIYNCSENNECLPVTFLNMTDLFAPNLNLKSCHIVNVTRLIYMCETIRIQDLNSSAKVAILSKIMRNNSYDLVNCLDKTNYTQLCHIKRDGTYFELFDHSKKEPRGPHEFICEKGKIVPLAEFVKIGEQEVLVHVRVGYYGKKKFPVTIKTKLEENATCVEQKRINCVYVKHRLDITYTWP